MSRVRAHSASSLHRKCEAAFWGIVDQISSRREFLSLTHTGPRLIAHNALQKAHLPWVLAVSDRTGFAEREIMECPALTPP
jgi:hypothetical protein